MMGAGHALCHFIFAFVLARTFDRAWLDNLYGFPGGTSSARTTDTDRRFVASATIGAKGGVALRAVTPEYTARIGDGLAYARLSESGLISSAKVRCLHRLHAGEAPYWVAHVGGRRHLQTMHRGPLGVGA